MPQPFTSGAESERAVDSLAEAVYREVLAAIRVVLDGLRRLVLGQPGVPYMGGWPGSPSWSRFVDDDLPRVILNAVVDVAERGRGRDGQDVQLIESYARVYLANVQSRLRDWPREAFESIRATLDDGIALGEGTERLRERVGDALEITAVSRTVQAEIDELYARIDRGVSADREREYRARIRDLYATDERSRREWEWRADRIARTEATGAVSAGVEAWAEVEALRTGIEWSKQWWSSRDGRVRPTHRAAHGQIVPMSDRFRVGGSWMQRPGDPLAPPGEVINCRCSLLMLSPNEVAARD